MSYTGCTYLHVYCVGFQIEKKVCSVSFVSTPCPEATLETDAYGMVPELTLVKFVPKKLTKVEQLWHTEIQL